MRIMTNSQETPKRYRKNKNNLMDGNLVQNKNEECTCHFRWYVGIEILITFSLLLI